MLRVFQFSNGDRGRNGDCKTKGTYPRKCENFSAKALREIATMKTAWPSMFQRWTVGETCRRLCPTAILREIYLSSASLNAFSSFSSISFSFFFFLLFFAFYIFFRLEIHCNSSLETYTFDSTDIDYETSSWRSLSRISFSLGFLFCE